MEKAFTMRFEEQKRKMDKMSADITHMKARNVLNKMQIGKPSAREGEE